MGSVIKSIIELDHTLFFILNGAHCNFLDSVMKFFSNIYVWIPMYLLITGCLFLVFPWKKALLALLGILLTFLITDQLSSSLIKEGVQRLRPSHMPGWEGTFRLLEGKGGLYSFVSSHAANVFGLACLSSLLYRKRWFTVSIYTWATLVSYSRIYVGKHFPLDVLCGACWDCLPVGLFFGYTTWFFIKSNAMRHRRSHN